MDTFVMKIHRHPFNMIFQRSCFILLLLLASRTGYGQVLNKGEYFFDTDPGTGNGTPLTFTAGASINTTFALNVSALATGFHNVNIRLRDNTGKWSHFQSRAFYLAPAPAVVPPATNVTKLEYFFDADPGAGNGTNVPITPGSSITRSVVVPITSLTTGFHNLNFRTRDDKGRWSHFATRTFYIVPPFSVAPATTLTEAEYFFDADPGVGNGTNITITPSAQINQTTVIPTTSLSSGFHRLNIRVRDNRGFWSHFATRSFYIIPPQSTAAATSLKKAEYFFDQDPGQGNGTPLTITSGNPQNNNFAIDISALPPGFHRLAVRYQDNQNRWGHFALRSFYIMPASQIGATTVSEVEYFVDTDPDLNPSLNGTSLPITPASSIDQAFAIDLSGVPSGNHTLYVRAKDNLGAWSTRVSADFTILTCTVPGPPSAPAASRCGPGAVTLSASGASGAQVYRWYDDNSTTTVLFTGSSFTTPDLSATRDYFVSIFDPNTLCESTRSAVTATIQFATKPVVNPSGSINLCEGNTVILSAPTGYTNYLWSNGETTRQILVSTGGNYSVQAGDANCLSPASDAVDVTFQPAPSKPTVTVTGTTTVCGTGSATLTGPAGFQYQWSTGETTQTITVSQTGVYTLRVGDGSTCLSLPSDPVAFTVLTPPCGGGGNPDNLPPVISNAPLASQIEGQVAVDLTQLVSDPNGNIDFSTLSVINNETSRGVAAFVDGSYFLQIDYSGTPFTGVDRVTIEACDLDGLCVQQVIDIEVVGEIVVYNGVTPDGNGYNDFLMIKYIGVVEGSSENKVTIFNRWGHKVFDATNYDNQTNVFDGTSNDGKELPNGTYFYTVDLANGKSYNGYITLKR